MKFTLEKIISWGLKLWLLCLPWQTVLIIRQVTVKDSLWAAGGVALPLAALYLLVLIGAGVFYYRKEILNFLQKNIIWWLAILTYLLFVIAQAPNQLLALQLLFFWGLGLGLLWLSAKNFISNQVWVWWLSVGAIAPIILGLYQFFAQSNFSSTWLGLSAMPSFVSGAPVVVGEWGRWLRASGPFPHPNIFAGYLVVIIAVIFNYFGTKPEFNIFKIWFYRGLIIFLSAALVATVSRAGLLAWGILVIEYFFVSRYWALDQARVLLFSSVLMVVVGVSLAWPLFSGRLGLSENQSIQEITAVHERLEGVEIAKEILKDNWLFGVGPGNYTVALKELKPELHGFELQPVHNIPLLFLVEWGIFGLVFLVTGFAWLWKKALNKPKFMLSLTVLLPLFLFDHYFYDIWVGIILLSIHISSTVYPHFCLNKPKK